MARQKALNIIVIDSSIAVKWFNREEGSTYALKLLEGHIRGKFLLAAPQLLFYEVANALRYNHDFGVQDVSNAIEELLDLQLAIVPFEKEWAKNASDISFKYGLTFYDASFIAAAKYLNAPLYTADKKILENVKEPFVKAVVEFEK